MPPVTTGVLASIVITVRVSVKVVVDAIVTLSCVVFLPWACCIWWTIRVVAVDVAIQVVVDSVVVNLVGHRARCVAQAVFVEAVDVSVEIVVVAVQTVGFVRIFALAIAVLAIRPTVVVVEPVVARAFERLFALTIGVVAIGRPVVVVAHGIVAECLELRHGIGVRLLTADERGESETDDDQSVVLQGVPARTGSIFLKVLVGCEAKLGASEVPKTKKAEQSSAFFVGASA
ncbi:MAG: hypothetical protein ACJAYU_002428 [Bradymonadia bacterium]|jgi:hypothetical protein